MTSVCDHPLVDAAGPFGAVGGLRLVRTDGCLPVDYQMYCAFTGNPSAVVGSYREDDGRGMFGTGRAYRDPARARLIAVSETMERFAIIAIDDGTLTTASAADLGAAAMDLDLIPRCSPRELRHPDCPVRPADPTAPIRWAPAVDLHSGVDVLVPGVMAYVGLIRTPAERFWMSISTGAATHTSFEEAVVNGVCELVERDALSLTWLQRLPLPRLADSCVPPMAREIIAWCDAHGVDTHLFDATTDVGVPTVYCVQTTREERNTTTAQIVGCGTDFDPADAALHAVLEAAGIRIGIDNRPRPRRYADYRTVSDGAAVMGRRSRRAAFGFLLDAPDTRPRSAPARLPYTTVTDRLSFLLRRLQELQMSVYVVDLTRRELSDAGLFAVQVIIPQLQPMSVRPLAQYRAHPRLYEAPPRMGLRALPERQLNPYPQPMS